MTPQKKILIAVVLIFFMIIGWYRIDCPPLEECPLRNIIYKPEKVTLTFVGPSGDESGWNKIIEKFKAYKREGKKGIDLVMEFETVNPLSMGDTYENILKDKQYRGEGPNIFMMFHSWLPKYKDQIVALPKGAMKISEYKETYATAAVEDLTDSDGAIYSIPLYIDTLALYYNNDMFLQESIIDNPRNWKEFESDVIKLTRYEEDDEGNILLDKDGNRIIEIMGAAIGGGEIGDSPEELKINKSGDIVMLMVMQNNYGRDNLVSFETEGAFNAVRYYTNFADPKNNVYTWNKDQIYSIDAFTQKKAAMIIGYQTESENIKQKNSSLNFRVKPIPQIDESQKVNYASYWSPAVSEFAPCRVQRGSKINCQELAWEFIQFATKEGNVKLYLDSTGKAAANLQLAKEQSREGNERSIFASQVSTARSWNNVDNETNDNILNNMINYINIPDYNKKRIKENRQTAIKESMAEVRRYIRATN